MGGGVSSDSEFVFLIFQRFDEVQRHDSSLGKQPKASYRRGPGAYRCIALQKARLWITNPPMALTRGKVVDCPLIPLIPLIPPLSAVCSNARPLMKQRVVHRSPLYVLIGIPVIDKWGD